ncbi:hypothetical protein DPEC_G00109370 [Dallia pectoralis]|uniref:Uncharacterized protein n=1 Tax=Dallia pectoralis TaxID=75939 RepID=A0ACC2GSC2_DALPE|nr:hypothetical protein DPEC_G00109370 [Dallia pectoralis]
MTLTESRDPCVSRTAPTLVTGRKWNSCNFSPGEDRPQAQRHHWQCAAGEDLAWETVDHRGKGQLQTSADGWSSRDSSARAGNKVRKGYLTSQARTMDEMGES